MKKYLISEINTRKYKKLITDYGDHMAERIEEVIEKIKQNEDLA